MQGEV
jgi:hypothetical protein